jgi:DOPA 4,5-dioxygenase
MIEVGRIHAWHAHVYYDAASKPAATVLRDAIAQRWPAARMGRMHDVPVGPHPLPMFQVAFEVADFAALAPFIALNRAGLTVLVHPESGRPKDDHLKHAMWLGAVLPLNGDVLPETD